MLNSTTSIDGYSWPGPFQPFDHQKETTEFIVANHRGFVFNDMGTGKTASLLWAADYLMSVGDVGRLLIVAPLSTIKRVWLDESFQLLMHRNTVLLYGPSAKRREKYEQSNWEIGIINFDGVKILKDLIEDDIKSGRLDMIAIDEATEYRNSQTKKYQTMKKLADKVPRLVQMTGAPCPEAPTDAYGLAHLQGNTSIPKFFGAWRRRTMLKVGEFQWVPRPDGFQQAFQVLQPAIRFRKEDCVDLPPVTYEQWEVELSSEQKSAYKTMQKKMAIEFADEGDQLPAVNAADKINKLRQIACGVVKDTGTGEYVLLDYKPRLRAVLAAIEQADAKVVVAVPFKGIIKQLAHDVGQLYTTEYINGDVSAKQRDDIITRFRQTSDPHVLMVHPKTMSHGITLVEADVMVIYAPIYSNDQATQIENRINRPGQTRSMTIVQLGASAMEWSIYHSTEMKAQGEAMLLEMYKQAMQEKV